MRFGSKRDDAFMSLFSFVVISMLVLFLVPLFVLTLSSIDKTVLSSVLLLMIGVLSYNTFFIKYEFHDEYLYIKGGVFFKRLRYDLITGVEATNFTTADLLAGYRILSSKDGVTIKYKTGMGSIKISPKEKIRFIKELEKRLEKARTTD